MNPAGRNRTQSLSPHLSFWTKIFRVLLPKITHPLIISFAENWIFPPLSYLPTYPKTFKGNYYGKKSDTRIRMYVLYYHFSNSLLCLNYSPALFDKTVLSVFAKCFGFVVSLLCSFTLLEILIYLSTLQNSTVLLYNASSIRFKLAWFLPVLTS